MTKFIERFKDWYTQKNNQWHLEQQQQALIMQQAYQQYNRQQLVNAGHTFLLFLRPLLNQITYFDTTSMRCDVVYNQNEVYRLCLQVPLRVSCQADLPSEKTLCQLIENLISTECLQRRNDIYNRAYNLQSSCCTPEAVMRYNKSVDDAICCFMNYRVGIHSLNSFKAVLVADCALDINTMSSFYLY